MVHNTLKKLRKGNNSVCYGGCLEEGKKKDGRVVGVCVCVCAWQCVCVSSGKVCFLKGFSSRGMKLDFKCQLAPEGCFFLFFSTPPLPTTPPAAKQNVKCEWESAPTCAF